MFKHLLVPLDGSRLAEAALPIAAFLAQSLQAAVTLIHIIERGTSGEIHGQRHLTTPDEARAYLNEMARRAFPAALQVTCHVHTVQTDDLARSIVDHVDELAPDLIVMCTHGSGGLRDLLYGSLAQQVVARGTTPVLLIRPDDLTAASSFVCRRLLVPLDGNPDHEQGLPVAMELARACAAELALVFVVPTLGTLSGDQAAAGRLLPGATRALLELAHQDAAQYLARHVAALQTAGLKATAVCRRGEPAATIVAAAQEAAADLIVLGTHGKAGMDAFWAGSIGPRISSRARIPLLLVPVSETTGR
ncbi:MAG: universal stress protein [Anaerolineae bacterium]|nr:universal stress protein [Anaerolineae bacterium]